MKTVWVVGLIGLSLGGGSMVAQPTKPVNGLTAGLKGEYFNGPNFEQKVLTRTDPQVDFDWNWQSPGPGVQREYFSARWTGKLYAPTSGKYRFSATVDDGVRVWVGGKKVIDEWRKQDDTQFVGEISLNGKQFYDLRVEYYNDWKGSIISVYWESPEDRRLMGFTAPPHQLIPAKYLFSRSTRPVSASAALTGRGPVGPSATGRPAIKPAELTLTAAKPVPTKRQGMLGGSAPAKLVSKPKPVLAPVVTEMATPTPAANPFDNLRAGKSIVLRHVVFAQSEYTLLPESYAELDKLVKALQANPAFRVEIAGHTDNVGDRRLNQSLSEHRAKVIAAYLVRHGVAEARISAKGYGDTQPVADNATEQQRAQNRRVELVVSD
ncbi:MAG: OmpA family protein [Bacteroidetes bacterium]|nr:OmpA family protein [Fibrella sp.]